LNEFYGFLSSSFFAFGPESSFFPEKKEKKQFYNNLEFLEGMDRELKILE